MTTVRDNVLTSKMTATYDALDRLVSARTTQFTQTLAETAPLSETYTYNAIGNLTGRFGVGGTGAITYPAAGSARPHAATEAANTNSYVYDSNSNMTVRREMSGTVLLVYTQTWSIDNRLIGVTKALSSGLVLAQTSYFYDGDGTRVRKDDPDGTTLYAGPVEQTIGPGGTAMAEYYDDISGPTLAGYVTTRSEPVVAGLQRSYTSTPHLPTMGDAPWAIRWQLWLTVPVTDTYTLAVFADDGFNFSGIGLVLTNTTSRVAITTETTSGVVLTPGLIYNFSLAYMNYTTATTSTIQLLWRRAGGQLELVPREAIHARGRRDYYSFAGAPVAMKEGVMASVTRTLSYLHGDHLGSASLTTDISGTVVSQQRYKPYGEVRWSSGAGMPTDKQFTSQTRLVEGYVGTLYDYVARAYDPVLERFISADTIVPGAGNGQALNRYMYVRGNPLAMVDPSGHMETVESDGSGCFGLDFNLCYSNAYRDLGFGAATSSYVEATAWTLAAERLEIKAHIDPDNTPIVEAAIGTRERANQLAHIADITSRKSVFIRPREYAHNKAGGETQAYAILSLVIDLTTAWLGAEMNDPTLSAPGRNPRGDIVQWGDSLWGLDDYYLVKTLDSYTTGAGMFGDFKANDPLSFFVRGVGFHIPVVGIVLDLRDIFAAFFEVYEQ